MFNRYKAFRSNIVNRGNEAENFNKYVEATVKALLYRPPKVRPKNLIFGGRFSFGKI